MAVADESGNRPADPAEAERIYLKAEELLDHELEMVEIERLAKQSLTLFSELGNNARLADAVRIVCHCLRYEEKRKEAAGLAKEYLGIFQSRGDHIGEAKMLISLAEANYDKRGSKKREMAIQDAKKAWAIAKQGRERRLEAMALIALVNAEMKTLERKGFSREVAQEPLEHAALAVELAADAGDKKLQACAFHSLSVGRSLCKDWDLTFKSSQEALEIYRALGLKKLEAYEMQCLAGWYCDAGDPKEAVTMVQASAEIFRQLGAESAWEAGSLFECVNALVKLKQFEEATSVAREARVRFRRGGAREAEAWMAQALITSQLAAEQWEDALVTTEEAIALYRKLRDKSHEAEMLIIVARIQMKQERFFRSAQAAQRALSIFQKLGDVSQQAVAFEILTDINLMQDQQEKALQFCNEERKIVRAAGDKRREAVALIHMANVHARKGETDEAVALATEATDLLEGTRDKKLLMHALDALVELLSEREDYEKALREAVKCKVLLRELEEPQQEVKMVLNISRIYVFLMAKAKKVTAETRDRAARAVKDAITLCRRQEAPPAQLTASALSMAAQVYLTIGRTQDATTVADEAVSLLHSLQDDAAEGYTLIVSAQAHLKTRRVQKSREKFTRALMCFERARDTNGQAVAQKWLEFVDQTQLRASSPTRDEAGELAVSEQQKIAAPVAAKQAFRSPSLDVELVRSKVSQITNQIIGATDPIHDDSPLLEVGLTSMSSAMLRDALARDFPESSLPFTLAFDYPSISAVAEYLVESTRMLD